MSKNTQPVSIEDLDISKVSFTEPKFSSIPNSTPKIEFCKVGVLYENPDGSRGDLVLTSDPLFSYGLSQLKDPSTKEVISHSMSFVLCDSMPPTEEEQKRLDKLNSLYDMIKSHIYECRKEVKRGSLKEHELLNIKPYSYRKNKDTGENDETKSPLWNIKLKEFKKRMYEGKEIEGKIGCNFYNLDEADEDGYAKLVDDPMILIGKRMRVTPMVKLESLFIGSKIVAIQLKLVEAEFKLEQYGPKRFLKSKVVDKVVKREINEDDDDINADSMIL